MIKLMKFYIRVIGYFFLEVNILRIYAIALSFAINKLRIFPFFIFPLKWTDFSLVFDPLSNRFHMWVHYISEILGWWSVIIRPFAYFGLKIRGHNLRQCTLLRWGPFFIPVLWSQIDGHRLPDLQKRGVLFIYTLQIVIDIYGICVLVNIVNAKLLEVQLTETQICLISVYFLLL